MKAIRVDWTNTSTECIGIVVGENERGERKAYIGVGQGFDESQDVQRILNRGGKILPSTLREIIDRVEGDTAKQKPKVVCLCRSPRYNYHLKKKNFELTLEGVIVLSIGCDTHSDVYLKITDEQKIGLDELHFRKIDMADEIFVINVDGYIGVSTGNEIEYARKIGKPIVFLEPCDHDYAGEPKSGKAKCKTCGDEVTEDTLT